VDHFKVFLGEGGRKLLETKINTWLGENDVVVVDAMVTELRLIIRWNPAEQPAPRVRVRLFKPHDTNLELELTASAQHDAERIVTWCVNSHFVFVFYEPRDHA